MLGVMGKYGVQGRNVRVYRLLEFCSELELVIGNTYFMKKSMFTLLIIDNERLIEISMIDYVLVERTALGKLVEVHVPMGAGVVSDHFSAVVRVKGGVGRRCRKEGRNMCSAGKS